MEHPVIIAKQSDFERVKSLYGKDAFITTLTDRLFRHADRLLGVPPAGYRTTDGLRLDGEEIQCIIDHLACAYRLSGKQRYAQRAIAEMDSVCTFPDWQNEHFLSTAAVAAGMAIGYDWVYEVLTEKQRTAYADAIERFALEPALEAYRGIAAYRSGQWFGQIGWTHSRTNWNGVCNGGMILAAAAILDSDRKRAQEVLAYAVESLRLLPPVFEPDGGFEEGVSYWLYLNLYLTKALATLENISGKEDDIFVTEAFRRSMDYAEAMNHGRFNFNFHDVGVEKNIDISPIMYYAKKFGRTDLGRKRVQDFKEEILPIADGLCTTDLLWYIPSFAEKPQARQAEDVYFRGIETAVLRDGGWAVALHGGSNTATHGHIDSGSVIIDALGLRWLCDLGKEPLTYVPNGESYDRWDLYRMRAEGHNTLVVDPDSGAGQEEASVCRIVSFQASGMESEAAMELTPAYPQAERITRTVRLDKQKQEVIITDELRLKKPSRVYSFFHTRAEAELTESGALLTQNGKHLSVSCNHPMEIMDAVPLASSPQVRGQAKNTGVVKLAVILEHVQNAQIILRFSEKKTGSSVLK